MIERTESRNNFETPNQQQSIKQFEPNHYHSVGLFFTILFMKTSQNRQKFPFDQMIEFAPETDS